MQRQQKKIRFRLIGDKKPISYQIPLRNLMLPRGDEGLKRVQYIPGAPSIWADQYKGDERPRDVWMEDGYLDVDPNDKNLLSILRNHPWMDLRFEQYDEQEEARRELKKLNLEERALARVNISDDVEAKANAAALFGAPALNWTPTIVRVKLKKEARENPQTVLDEMGSDDYHAKYAGALSLLRGALNINATMTAVTWEDGKVLIRVPAGQDPVKKLAEYLSQDNEESQIVLQELGERIRLTRDTSKKKPNLEEALSQLAEESEPEQEVDPAPELSLKEAQDMFKKQHKRNVPPKFKEDIEWIKSRLDFE